MYENSDRVMAQATDAPPSSTVTPPALIRTIQEYLASLERETGVSYELQHEMRVAPSQAHQSLLLRGLEEVLDHTLSGRVSGGVQVEVSSARGGLFAAVRCACSSEFPAPDEARGTTLEDISQEFASAGGWIRVDPLSEGDTRIGLWLPPAAGGPD